jgi:hypothetical protein
LPPPRANRRGYTTRNRSFAPGPCKIRCIEEFLTPKTGRSFAGSLQGRTAICAKPLLLSEGSQSQHRGKRGNQNDLGHDGFLFESDKAGSRTAAARLCSVKSANSRQEMLGGRLPKNWPI